MYKSCSRCGKIHDINYKCTHNKPKYDNHRYKTIADMPRYSFAWQKKSKEIKESSNYLCEVCLDLGAYNYSDLEVHHINKLREDPNSLLVNENLITLCKLHHMQAEKGHLSKEYLTKLAKIRENKHPPLTNN